MTSSRAEISRRALLAGLMGSVAAPALAEAPLMALRPVARKTPPSGPVSPEQPDAPPVRTTVADLIAQADLGGVTAVRLVDLNTGEALVDIASDVAQPPASVTKAVTALYAMSGLPVSHRFSTTLWATGQVVGDVLNGDLILAGGGDPTLNSDGLNALARDLAATGVRRISGRFYVWAEALPYAEEIEPDQADHLGYNPAVSGLNLNFNRVHFGWQRQGSSYRVTMDARTDLISPAVGLPKMDIVSRALPVFASHGPDQWSVARSALGKSGARWLPVRQPALYAGEVFQVLARSQGVTLPAAQKTTTAPQGTVMARHDSPPLEEIVRGMLEYSTNLTAEVLGLATSNRNGVPARTIYVSAARMNNWLKETFGVEAGFVDHSGLDQDNRVSARVLTDVLRAAAPEGRLAPLLKEIAIGEAPDYPGAVRAKTGTLNFVSALSGYVTGAGGRRMGFAILSANPELRAQGQASGEDVPPGALSWNTRAKALQEALLRRWRLAS